MDPMRLYVVFDPGFEPAGSAWVSWLADALSGLGMQRDGCRFGVPVQWRSQPWGAEQPGLPGVQHPRRIALDDAASNCVLLLMDDSMGAVQPTRWVAYVEELRARMAHRAGRDLLVTVMLTAQKPLFPGLPHTMRGAVPDLPSQPQAAVRFLVQLLNALLVHRQPESVVGAHRPGHGIFVSHAKRDGWRTAERIVQVLSRVGQGARPAFFLDTDSLVPGSDFESRFEAAIGAGSLLALATDAYHTRPWCRWELLTAKRLGRPIVVADLSSGRIERTLPYLGNVPSQRVPVAVGDDDDDLSEPVIEQLALALLSEALRFDLWLQHARERMAGRHCRLMARPPELTDLAEAAAQANGNPQTLPWMVYPDPPLGREEVDLLGRAFPQQGVFSLSQALARS
ncbi:toll/interleukin-1 receptor domain-containing protein [Ideonella sp. A 288]|uniref:toll/interleukin-1 receptor domain-containing protein n=1 Tax=Ideonella sp. A 288 TaxID=1962181 RepID=UPI001303D6EE|nr:toll/interleukin-1 receptor domain-containing protein [Ideonella sp. A 288]